MITDLPTQQSFRPPRAGNSNVYLLGAGFSAEAGLPTIADFLNQMRDSTDWLAQQGRQAELTAVDAVLEFRHHAAAAGYRVNVDLDNIEDLFSLAAALPQQAASRDVQAAIGATLNYSQSRSRPPQVRMRVSAARGWPITPAWRAAASRVSPAPDSEDVECSAYDYYASVLAGRTSSTDKPNRNIVITFNYDLLLEEALDRLAIPFSYGLGTDNVTYDSTARSTTEPEEGSLLILGPKGRQLDHRLRYLRWCHRGFWAPVPRASDLGKDLQRSYAHGVAAGAPGTHARGSSDSRGLFVPAH